MNLELTVGRADEARANLRLCGALKMESYIYYRNKICVSVGEIAFRRKLRAN
jgi:hypothetical protein